MDVDQKRRQFQGFKPIEGNFIYCPNQFFDVCLSNCSRGGVRFIGYLLLRTLGWLDKEGNPIQESFGIPHSEIIRCAGVSKGAIGDVVDELIAGGFLERPVVGEASSKGNAGRSAQYTLRWDRSGQYVTNPAAFRGFYVGVGNCSPIPITFFSEIVPECRLSLTRVVGTVLRHTVGFEGKYGGRRPQASLSLSFMQRYANIKDRKTTFDAVHEAIDCNFIRQVEAGCFDGARANRRSATYAPKWLASAENPNSSSKTQPRGKKQFKNPTNPGSKTQPIDRFKNPTNRKTDKKNTNKQQAAANVTLEIQSLLDAGFDKVAATEIAQSGGVEEIQNQIAWFPKRKANRNPLGMLRTAIEQGWAPPPEIVVKQKKQELTIKQQASARLTEELDTTIEQKKKDVRRRRGAALPTWRGLSQSEQESIASTAFSRLASDFDRRRFQTNETYRLDRCLDELIRSDQEVLASPTTP